MVGSTRINVRLEAMKLAYTTLGRRLGRPPSSTQLAVALGRSAEYVRYTARQLKLTLYRRPRSTPKTIVSVEEARIRCAKQFGSYLPLLHLYQPKTLDL